MVTVRKSCQRRSLGANCGRTRSDRTPGSCAFALNGDVLVGAPWLSTLRMRRCQFPLRDGNGGTKSHVRSTTMVAPSPESYASPTLCRLGGIYIGPPLLPAFSCSGRLATGKGWRTKSQSSWKALARRIEPAIGRSPQQMPPIMLSTVATYQQGAPAQRVIAVAISSVGTLSPFGRAAAGTSVVGGEGDP